MPGVKPATPFATIRLNTDDFESLAAITEPQAPAKLDDKKIQQSFLSLNDKMLNALSLTSAPSGEKPLSSENAALYRDIFRLQAFGRMKAADQKIARLTDTRLLSDVLYQRYMHPAAYRSSYEELSAWLKNYPGHPDADKIQNLALSRKPAGAEAGWPKIKSPGELPDLHEPLIDRAKRHKAPARSAEQAHAVATLTRRVKGLIDEGEPALAMETLFTGAGVQYMDNVERDTLRAEAAQRFLFRGQTAHARDLAREAVQGSREKVPLAGWVAGLALWHERNYAGAADNFAIAGSSPYASGWMSSAGSYWAGRAHGRAGNKSQAQSWYAKAAKHDRTFYGLLATQALGRKPAFDWREPQFAYSDEKKLLSTPEGRRAAAFVAAGQYELAERELVHFDYSKNPEMRRVALAYATHVGLPSVAMRLGSRADNRRDKAARPYDAALYPLMPWEPRRGFTVDPALIHAIVRQESRFNPQARNPSGASGLMQIMPATARHILRGVNVADADIAPLLGRPADNLTLGQSYIKELLADKNVNGDMISMLAAYNAGPGNLARWKQKFGNIDDPLLFAEMIPVAETRTYVKRVMAFYWIYSLRGGQGAKTLEALAAGKTPRYAALADGVTDAYKLAANQ